MIVSYKDDNWATTGILNIASNNKNRRTLVIALHAGGSNKAGSRRSFIKLSSLANEAGLSVFRFDMPYDGESKVFKDSIDRVSAIHDLLLHIKKTYNFERIILVGHCVGGRHSINLSIRYPQLIDKIVLWHIAPILYAMEEEKKAPKLHFRYRLGQIYASLRELKHNPAALIKTTLQSLSFLLAFSLHPFKLLGFFLKSLRAENKEINKENVGDHSVLIIINPSRTHYKVLSEGMAFIKKILFNYGFRDVRFIENNNKVFSIQWQKITLRETVSYIKSTEKEVVENYV